MQHTVAFRAQCLAFNITGFYLDSPHDRNNQYTDVGWETEWNSLSNESWVAEKEPGGTSQKMIWEFRKWWDLIL